MKKSRFFSALLIVSLLFVLFPANAKAAMWDVPVGPGETFRWVFVTSSSTQATSSDIDYYNGFVDAAADAADGPIPNLVGFEDWAEIDWMAIASTYNGIDAIDNIGASTAGIYTPMGDLVANGTSDMFDLDIASPINVTETGATYEAEVWTGSDADGTEPLGGWALGNTNADTGLSGNTGALWLSGPRYQVTHEFPLYAISEELTVVPVPGALILAATGLLSSTLGLKRLRCKHQE